MNRVVQDMQSDLFAGLPGCLEPDPSFDGCPIVKL